MRFLKLLIFLIFWISNNILINSIRNVSDKKILCLFNIVITISVRIDKWFRFLIFLG